MSASLLGLPLERALRELERRGMREVAVNRLLAPRRGAQTPGEDGGEWRVVRVRDGETVTLDACCFEIARE